MKTPLFLILLTITVYWGVWHGYFQQDEWSGFGRVVAAQESGFGSLVRFSGHHFTPFSIFNVALLYTFFGLNHIPYGIYSVLLHAANVICVYYLALLMVKKRFVALGSAIVFLSLFTPFQAVTWYAASLSVLPGTFFALLSLICFELYRQKLNTRMLLLACILVLVSAGFRENTAVLLLYMGIREKRAWRWLTLTALLYLSVRFVPLLFSSRLTTVAPHTSRFALFDIAYQTVTFTLFHLPRLVIPTPVPITIAGIVFGSAFRLAYDSILGIFYAFVWVCAVIVVKFVKVDRVMNHAVLLIFLSLLPLTLIPIPAIMESRHFYLTGVGFSLLAGGLLNRYSHNELLIALMSLFLILNIALMRQEIGSIQQVSQTRIRFMQDWQSLFPSVPANVVIFVSGDPLPFQSGFGHMLLVLYRIAPLLDNYFLWGIHEEGYKEAGGRGFGYFTDFPSFQDVYCADEFTPNAVLAATWDSKNNRLSDITTSIQSKLVCPHE